MKQRQHRLNRETKQHILYASIFLVVIIFMVLLGNYQKNVLKADYTSQMVKLETNLLNLKMQLNEQAQEQKQVTDLISNDVVELTTDLQLIAQEQGMQIKSLSEKNLLLGQQISNLEITTEGYADQLGELDQQLSDLSVESESFSRIIDSVVNSVVSIVTDRGQGSGAIITEDGLVVTNYHVIQNIQSAAVITYSGDRYAVNLVRYDADEDIAVLRIRANETFDAFDFADSDDLRAGQKVVALGNPAGLSFTATEGIISSPSRRVSDGNTYIQTDVTINPGNSGGPLINSKGEIIGIINFKISNYESLGFAIPSNRVVDILEGFGIQ